MGAAGPSSSRTASTQEEYLSCSMALACTGLPSISFLELVSTWTQIPNPCPRTLPHGTPEWLALTPSFLRAMYIHVDACAYQLQYTRGTLSHPPALPASAGSALLSAPNSTPCAVLLCAPGGKLPTETHVGVAGTRHSARGHGRTVTRPRPSDYVLGESESARACESVRERESA